ncbi:LysE family translocator [Plantactinospora sp. B6F1]|uniref:LysE family transporter n=1 Tax=Plantactinospora sp. B6F1 TaxID=3158971 RepID=UPI00102B811C
MSWTTYGTFLLFAVVLIVVPGPDFAVVTRNTLAAGRGRGWWSAVGVACSNAVQGSAAAAGLGAVIVGSQPLFQTIKWVGVGYLAFLGLQALRSAWRGRYAPIGGNQPAPPGQALAGWRQGFLSNITNPKVLAFYLAVLPQFVGERAPLGVLLLFALSHAVLSLLYLLTLVGLLHRARRVLSRRRVRRAMDAGTGVAMLGFSVRLATERA